MRVLDVPILEFDGFEERSAQPLNDRAYHLIAQPIGIDDRSAFERFDGAHNAHTAGCAVHRNFGARGHVAPFLGATSQAEPLSLLRFLPRPAAGFCGSFQYSTHPHVRKVLQTELKRIHFSDARQCIHVGLAREMVCCSSQTTVGTTTQNQGHLMVLCKLIRNIVRRFDPRHAGMVVVKFPRRQFSIARDPAADFDNARRTEVRPSEFFLARPDNFYRLSGSARQTRGFDGRITGVLPSVGGAGIRNDHANIALWNVKNAGEFVTVRERPLRSGPYRKLAIGPLRHGCARLERGMRDVCHVVGCIDAVRRSRKSFFQGAFLPPKPLIGRRLSVLLEVRKDFLAGYLRHFLPLRVNGVESFLRFMCARRRHRDEVSIAHDRDTRHSFCRGVIV